LETYATTTHITKVTKLSAEPKTIGTLDHKHKHCAMRSLPFDWQYQRFIRTASCQADLKPLPRNKCNIPVGCACRNALRVRLLSFVRWLLQVCQSPKGDYQCCFCCGIYYRAQRSRNRIKDKNCISQGFIHSCKS